jgi:uncharacterized membrane protein YgcG
MPPRDPVRLFPTDHRCLPLVVSVALALAPMAGAAAPGRARGDVGGGARAGAPAAGALWIEEGALGGSAAGAALRARLEGAARRAGVPIAILVLGRQAAGREPLEEIARRTFAERHLAGTTGTPDAVLLVAAPALRRSVIETGKGDAGIVPEIDARAITAELQRRFGRSSAGTDVGQALSDAADRIATSILATEERRRPLADEEPDGGATPARALQAEPVTTGGPARDQPATPGPRRTMLPAAAGLAIMLVLALGLRQRRRRQDDGSRKSEPPRR